MSMLIVIGLALAAGFFLVNRINSRGIIQVDAGSAAEMIKKPSTAVIDVRTPAEYRSGHLKGAIPVPVGEISGRIGALAAYRDRQVLVTCLSGSRSMSAARILRQNGFTRVANLKGGLNAWISGGFSVVKGS
jgi:rhodanese-related sulfurtransferase